jgi:hypothetical protein
MTDFRDLQLIGIYGRIAIAAAFVACFVTVIFSWPDRHDRKRAVVPHPLKCCEIRIAHWVVVPGARAERERLWTAANKIRAETPTEQALTPNKGQGAVRLESD